MKDWLKLLISVVIGLPIGWLLACFLIKWFGVEAALVGLGGVIVCEMIYMRMKIK